MELGSLKTLQAQNLELASLAKILCTNFLQRICIKRSGDDGYSCDVSYVFMWRDKKVGVLYFKAYV